MNCSTLLSLPKDILILLPDYIHNIEDYTNLSSTCTALRDCMNTASPGTILRLAAAQSTTFFRPSPHFLVTATARELGDWARESATNEAELASRLGDGIDGLLDLSLEHCGLTMERIRQLHLQRFSIINPVTDLIDKCVGSQWYATPDFWHGGADDAYTIDADPPATLFHLALYGELFGPDFEAFLDPAGQSARRLSVETRLEFIKYCVPDYATFDCQKGARGVRMPDGQIDPRRAVKPTGPYAEGVEPCREQNNIALVWVIQSSRWKPNWRAMRARAGVTDFQSDFADDWWYDPDGEQDWKQRMLEAIMICQGLDGLGMIRPGLQDGWVEKIRAWKEKIASLEKEPQWTKVGRQATLEYPFLLGDLRICGTGYVCGT
jgi:hypothetical protein